MDSYSAGLWSQNPLLSQSLFLLLFVLFKPTRARLVSIPSFHCFNSYSLWFKQMCTLLAPMLPWPTAFFSVSLTLCHIQAYMHALGFLSKLFLPIPLLAPAHRLACSLLYPSMLCCSTGVILSICNKDNAAQYQIMQPRYFCMRVHYTQSEWTDRWIHSQMNFY